MMLARAMVLAVTLLLVGGGSVVCEAARTVLFEATGGTDGQPAHPGTQAGAGDVIQLGDGWHSICGWQEEVLALACV